MKTQILEKLESMLSESDLEIADIIDDADYDGAESCFGHADDCLDTGRDLGYSEAVSEMIAFVKKLKCGCNK